MLVSLISVIRSGLRPGQAIASVWIIIIIIYWYQLCWNRSTFCTKIWLKKLVKIPPTFVSYYVTNSVRYYVVICFLSFMFYAIVAISCNYSLSGDDYMSLAWSWNAFQMTMDKCYICVKNILTHARKVTCCICHKVFDLKCISLSPEYIQWYLYKITVSHGIALTVYKLYFHSTILKMI